MPRFSRSAARASPIHVRRLNVREERRVGSGGGESSGALVFPDAPADGTEYLLHLEADSENTTIGDEGRLTWDVTLQ
jgi:hypothetical protein